MGSSLLVLSRGNYHPSSSWRALLVFVWSLTFSCSFSTIHKSTSPPVHPHQLRQTRLRSSMPTTARPDLDRHSFHLNPFPRCWTLAA